MINWTLSILFCICLGLLYLKHLQKLFSPRVSQHFRRIPSYSVTPRSAFKQRQMTGTRSSHVMGTVIASTLAFSTWRPRFHPSMDWFSRKISTGNHRFSHEIWGFRGSIFPETLGFWGPAMTRWLCSSMVWKPETGAPVATLNILQTYPPVLQLGHGKSHMRSTHFPWSSSALALPFRCSWSFIMFDTSSDPKIAIWTNTRSDSNAMQYDNMMQYVLAIASRNMPKHPTTK